MKEVQNGINDDNNERIKEKVKEGPCGSQATDATNTTTSTTKQHLTIHIHFLSNFAY